MTDNRTWRKSSRSEGANNCVELRQDLTAVRDSKRPGPVLPANVSALVEWARSR